MIASTAFVQYCVSVKAHSGSSLQRGSVVSHHATFHVINDPLVSALITIVPVHPSALAGF